MKYQTLVIYPCKTGFGSVLSLHGLAKDLLRSWSDDVAGVCHVQAADDYHEKVAGHCTHKILWRKLPKLAITSVSPITL